MELSVIIVNWNSLALLRACLKSIARNSHWLDLEVLVLDNASYDGSEQAITKEFPSVRFIQSHENLGFAGGSNRAFEQSRGAYVLFLNPDTEIIGNAVQRMLDFLKTRPQAGMVGPKLVNPDLKVQLGCRRTVPSIFGDMFDSALSRRIFAKQPWWGVAPLFDNTAPAVPVEMLPGTCIMLARGVFEAAGKFSEQYFMYAEDIELSCKIRALGLINYLYGDALVVHHGGCSSSQQSESNFSTVMMRESIWKFLRANRGASYALIYRAATLIAALGRILVLSAGRLALAGSARMRAARSTKKWTRVLRWCLGIESWASNYRPAPVNKAIVASKAGA